MSELPESVIAQMQEEQFLRQQLTVTEADYRDAVNVLIPVAQGDTSNAVVAAQVLLSLYNGRNWHVDLCDLGCLDYKNLQAALIAIRGRVFVLKEPQSVVDNGVQIFMDLETQWQHLHTRSRYKNNPESL